VLSWVHKVTSRSWLDIRNSGGKPGNKEGLAFTSYPDGISAGPVVPEGRTLSSMRVTDQFRIWGYRRDAVYYAMHFDRGHRTTR
jgi:hypothetical protein